MVNGDNNNGIKMIEDSFEFLENDIKACRFEFALRRIKDTKSLIDNALNEKVINLRDWLNFEGRLDDTIKDAENCICSRR